MTKFIDNAFNVKPKRGLWRIDLSHATLQEKQQAFDMFGLACRPNATGIEQLHNGAKWVDYPKPTQRDKALSHVVSRNQSGVINSNYRYAHRKVNKHKLAVNSKGNVLA